MSVLLQIGRRPPEREPRAEPDPGTGAGGGPLGLAAETRVFRSAQCCWAPWRPR